MIKRVLLSLLLVILMTSCDYKQENITPSGKVVKIGVLAPLSGQHERFGNQSLLGLKSANKMQPYLSNGDKIIFEIVDAKRENNTSLKALSKLAKNDDIVAMFSFMGSNEMLSLAPHFQELDLPVVATIATHTNIAQGKGNIAQVCMSNHMQTMVSSHYVRDEKLINHIGIVYNKNSTYSESLADEFKKHFKSIGGNVDFFIDISNDAGFKQFISKKEMATRMLFNVTNAPQSVKILKALNELNWDIEMLGTDGLLSDALDQPESEIELFNGVYVVEHYAHSNGNSKKHKSFKKHLKKRNLQESSYAFLAYDGYQLLINALENCKNYETTCINTMLQNSGTIEGISGNFSMKNAKVKRAIYIDKIEDAKLKKEVIIY